ncbi:MAG TPA: phosphatidylinositol-specific phospholipase C1-like protein [Acidimicrobiales bacterium]|nr:phosphatidylinositol-specific phospholipase C1-like protein [Acidimicrobiales bacterium]
MRKVTSIAAVCTIIVAGLMTTAGAATSGVDDNVKLNQIQVVGSHNSYHLRATQAEYEVREGVAPEFNVGLDYEHPALGVQFSSQRVRQIELDIFADPDGGLYSDPLIRSFASEGPLPASEKAAMDAPGIKVLHAQDVDYRSNCLTFVACLGAVKTWSDAHPDHAPIAILLELKDDKVPVVPSPPAVTPVPWTSANIASIDDEINSVFGADSIVRPDDVRGTHATVNEGVLAGNWPTLGASRGKVLFLMDNDGKQADYLQAFPGLRGADLFTNASPGDPDAAFIKMNTPTGENLTQIQDLVRQGYVVRTRSDADTIEARANDTSTRDAALTSGAQWVSTDFPGEGSAALLDSTYSVEIPGGVTARCNPINGPADCVDAALDTVPVEPLPPGALGIRWVTAPPTTPTKTPPTTTRPGHTTGSTAPVATPVSAHPRFTG